MKTQVAQKKQNAYYDNSGSTVNNVLTVITQSTAETTAQITVLCVYTANITLSSTPAATDGVTPFNGAYVLVAGQTTKSQNGLYAVNTSGSWSRVHTLTPFMFVFVETGTQYKNSIFMLTSPVYTIETGVSDIEFKRVDITNITSFGTMAFQNANAVNITGGSINIPASTNSGMAVGNSSSITLNLGSGSPTLTIRNNALTTYFRMVSSERFDALSNTNTNTPYYFQLNSLTNTQPFLQLVRNRTAGSASTNIRTVVNTNSTINIFDSITNQYQIQPTSGTMAQNALSHIVTSATANPDTAFEVGVTVSGVLTRVLRVLERGIQIWRGTANAVRILVSNSLTINYDLILPITAPSGGKLIGVDGTGQMSFEDLLEKQLVMVTSNTTMSPNKHYLITGNASARIEVTLPPNNQCFAGMYIRVTKLQNQTNLWRIKQNAGQVVSWNSGDTTTGTAGHVDSNSQDCTAYLMCTETDSNTYAKFQILQQEGLPTLV